MNRKEYLKQFWKKQCEREKSFKDETIPKPSTKDGIENYRRCSNTAFDLYDLLCNDETIKEWKYQHNYNATYILENLSKENRLKIVKQFLSSGITLGEVSDLLRHYVSKSLNRKVFIAEDDGTLRDAYIFIEENELNDRKICLNQQEEEIGIEAGDIVEYYQNGCSYYSKVLSVKKTISSYVKEREGKFTITVKDCILKLEDVVNVFKKKE